MSRCGKYKIHPFSSDSFIQTLLKKFPNEQKEKIENGRKRESRNYLECCA